MNILTDSLPKAVTIDGENYPIHTDFRIWVKFEITMLDNSVNSNQKAIELLALCYKKLPPTFDGAIQALIGFYTGARINNESNGGKGGKSPIYSFEYDADYIYAAFLGQYGIDLQTANLHWWQFKSLFKSLNNTNQIIKIMEYRSVDLSKIKDKEQKAFYRKMKNLYKLPDLRSAEEKEKAMINELSSLF